ncbi:MAG: hypothetical protein K2M07_04200 [Muribaculaceae bacterium]|nr:hypothetical protein [Muribaculaceae bacterium]
MRNIFALIFICLGLSLFAKDTYKVNIKREFKPYSVKVEKVKYVDNEVLVFCIIKQYPRFSYSISFTDCFLATEIGAEKVQGKLVEWNDNKKISSMDKTISDRNDEHFVLEFPMTSIPLSGKFELKIGNILDKHRTEFILKDLEIKK